MSEINYKAKYQELKLKFMNSVDMAFRLGFEQGAQQAQNDQMMQQQQQEQEMQQAAMGQAPGMPGEQGGDQPEGAEAPQDEAPMSEHPGGSELDQHIAKLESLIGKSEDPELKKSLTEFKSFRKSQLLAIELKKSEKALKSIAKSLKMPKQSFSIAPKASHNLPDNAKKSLSMQEKIVGDIMKAWSDEESKGKKDILSTLNVENLLNNKG